MRLRGAAATRRRRLPRAPRTPVHLERRNWRRVLKRTFKEFREDNVMDLAAALTYYAVLASFPAMLVFVAILGLAGQHPQTTNAVLEIVGDLGPQSAVDTFEAPLREVIESKGGATAILGVGLAGALWAASGYVGAFMRASNRIYEVEEGRPFWKLRPLQIALTVAGVLLLALVAIALVVTGPIAESIGAQIGLGDTAVTLWNVLKWPVMLTVVMAMFAALFYISPNVRRPAGVHWVGLGGVLAVLVWVLASAGFALYVANFGSYNATYGTLGGVVIFLVWLWVSNIALLLGVELNAEVERERELAAGLPAEERIQLPPREAADGLRSSAEG